MQSGRGRTWAVLALLLLVCGAATTLAMRRTSTTFDETILVAGGARGWATGAWELAPEHPPLTQYAYGLLPHLSGAVLPDTARWGTERYTYASAYFFAAGNDPERLAFLGRLPAVLAALLLVLAVFLVVRRRWGEGEGLLAAALVAFTPDVLAHGGVAYNDVPVTLALFVAVWLGDAALRRPSLARGAAFGAAAGLALATKNSALVVGPVALLLLAAEALVRGRDGGWWRRLAPAGLAALAAAYLVLVAVYRGDVALAEYRYAVGFVLGQVAGEGMPGYILGSTVPGGRWWYFPVAFLFKTSAAYHLLLMLAGLHLARRPGGLRALLRSPLRVPVAALLVVGPALVTSELNLGFRYALPALPMLAVLVAVGVAEAWRAGRVRTRALVVAAVAWAVLHPLSYYPHFLTYVSEYGPGRARNYTVLADASMDWGQGLLELRDYMAAQGIASVYLSYYGSAWPAGYGIRYVPLSSFLPLPEPGAGAEAAEAAPAPRHVVISATNLAGAGFMAGADPFRAFRSREPLAVLGHTMYVFQVR